MADIADNIQKLNDIEISSDAPLSEALMSKTGANVNALIDYKAGQEAKVTALTISGSATSFGSSVTIISFAATLTANDGVALELYGTGTTFAAGTFSVTSLVGAGPTLAWKRGSTTLQSTSSGATLTASGRFIDNPGAGSFTYTLVATSGGSGTYTGIASMQKLGN